MSGAAPAGSTGSSAVASVDWPTWQALQQLYADYASALDSAQWSRWPDFFTDDGRYGLIPRENHERGFPLATLRLDSRGMRLDRVYGIEQTLFHDPYYQRHVVGAPLVRHVDGSGAGLRLHCEANYAVFRTKLSEPSTVFNVGRYLDEVVATDAGLRFAQRLCVYDSELIPNALIYPV